MGLVCLTESVLDNTLRIQTVSGAEPGDTRARRTARSNQVLPAGMKHTLQIQVHDTSDEERTAIYLPPTLETSRSVQGMAKV